MPSESEKKYEQPDPTINAIIIAYACEPNKPSEPAVGWNCIHEIAKFANVVVITRSNNRKSIETSSTDGRIKFVYVDYNEAITKLKKSVPICVYP